MLNRKPIICAEGSEELCLFTYKHKFIGWAWNVPILFYTDLSYKEFENFWMASILVSRLRNLS